MPVSSLVFRGRYSWLAPQGFRQVLLVAGEHPKFVSNNYLADCVRLLAAHFPSIAIEVGPLPTEEYRPVVAADSGDVNGRRWL